MPLLKSMSLERKLPLVMTAVLAAVLGTALILGYGQLRGSAEDATSRRMTRAVQGVAATVESSTDGLVRRVAGLAEAPAVVTAARRGSPPEILDALRRHILPRDTAFALEFWSPAGARVAFLGGDVSPGERATVFPPDAAVIVPAVRATVSKLYVWEESTYFWIVASVRDGSQVRGYVAQKFRLGGPGEAVASMRQMMGEEVALAMRNLDGTVWTTPAGALQRPMRRDSSDDILRDVMADGELMITAEAPIRDTPWMVVLQTPVRTVHARVLRGMMRHMALALSMLVLGAVLAWAVSRRITRPIASLTDAVEAMARGDFTGRVHAQGGEELERLATSFNQLAAELESSRRELEGRIRETVAAGAELERANERLRMTNEELEQARESAERANQAKGNFLAVMSHELRTPLNAISGYADLIRSGVYGPATEGQREALARIAQNQEHLLTMIEDVLDFAQIDAGRVRYEFEDVELEPLLRSLEAHIAPQLREKNLGFEYRPAPRGITVHADRHKLRQVLVNLLTNAVKFTPAGGHILLETALNDTTAAVHVRDTGVGIPMERRAAIFEAFVQGDRTLSRPERGVGLGLAIGREFARAFGGELTVESQVGIGSTFTLTLKLGAGVVAPVRALEASGA